MKLKVFSSDQLGRFVCKVQNIEVKSVCLKSRVGAFIGSQNFRATWQE